MLTDQNEVIVDENSMMRSHMLMATFIPKGCLKYPADPFFLNEEEPAEKVNLLKNYDYLFKQKFFTLKFTMLNSIS